MSVEWKLAWRYFRSKRHHPFIGVTKQISILGVALGVAALIVVLGVMNGFEKDLKERIIGTYAHAVIEADEPFPFTPELDQLIRSSSTGITALSPFIQGQALFERSKTIEGVLVKGASFEPEREVTSVEQYIIEGEYPAEGTRGVLIGDALAERLRANVGDEIKIVPPGKKKHEPLVVAGIFHSGMYEYDAHLAYVPLGLAQELFDLGSGVLSIGVRYAEPELAQKEKRALQETVGFPYYVRTWADMNRSLFGALKLEKLVMFIILTLIVAVACFNIVGTLTLLVIDKTKDIGILKALGVPPGQVMRLFTINGLFIGFWGTLLGVAAGAGICYVLKTYPLIELPSDIYYFSRLPVEIRAWDIGIIAACSMLLSLLSTLYPAMAGASLKPVQALRYE